MPGTACSCNRTLQASLFGGGGNQRESVINSVLVALLLEVDCLVLPNVSLIAIPVQEYGHRGRASYASPFDDRSSWYRFGNLFDAAFFQRRMHRLGLCTVDPEAAIVPADLLKVRLPNRWANPDWDKYRPRLLNHSYASLLQTDPSVSKEAERQALTLLATTPKPAGPTRVLYTMQTGNTFRVSRGQSLECWRLNVLCGYATRSIRASPFIASMTSRITNSMLQLTPKWHAIHLRAWGWSQPCKPRDANIEFIVNQTRIMLPQPGEAGLYLASEHSAAVLVRERFQQHFRFVASKENTSERIRELVPFEVCAQIDFEVAHTLTAQTGGVYFMTPASSSDHDLAARRWDLGLPSARTMCYDGQLCIPHVSPCPVFATSISA